METKAKKKWKTPHTFVILVVIILIAAAATLCRQASLQDLKMQQQARL